MSDEGKKRLKDLAAQVREKATSRGAPSLDPRGLALVDELARELGSPDAMPGLRINRDGPHKFRLSRTPRNADILVEWQRDVGALGITCEKHGEPKMFVRYVWDQPASKWRKLDGGGEIWEDIAAYLTEYLYPEAKQA